MRTPKNLWRSGLLLLAGMLVSGALWSAERPFNDLEFDAAQRAGKPVVVAVHAHWCPTCRVQERALRDVLGREQFAQFTMFRVDYDYQKTTLKRFAVTVQSTLIVFKGVKEVARSIAQTHRDAIAADLEKAL